MGISPSYVVTSPLQSTESNEVNLSLFSLKPITYPCLQLLCQNNIKKSSWETSEAGRQRENFFDQFRDAQIYLNIKLASGNLVRYWGHSFHSKLKIQGGPICDINSNVNESTGIKWSVFSCAHHWCTEEYYHRVSFW